MGQGFPAAVSVGSKQPAATASAMRASRSAGGLMELSEPAAPQAGSGTEGRMGQEEQVAGLTASCHPGLPASGLAPALQIFRLGKRPGTSGNPTDLCFP